MTFPAPNIIHSEQDVTLALREIGLSCDIVTKVARAAAAARAEALAIDPISTPGLLSYIYGVRTIRLQLIPAGWRISRMGNVESTINDELGIQLFFQNVDIACNVGKIPHAISAKGSESRRQVAAGQTDLFDDLVTTTADKIGSIPKVWLICVAADESSIKAEVSCPTSFEGTQFEDFHQRIFVLDEPYDAEIAKAVLDSDGIDQLDVPISKKD